MWNWGVIINNVRLSESLLTQPPILYSLCCTASCVGVFSRQYENFAKVGLQLYLWHRVLEWGMRRCVGHHSDHRPQVTCQSWHRCRHSPWQQPPPQQQDQFSSECHYHYLGTCKQVKQMSWCYHPIKYLHLHNFSKIQQKRKCWSVLEYLAKMLHDRHQNFKIEW